MTPAKQIVLENLREGFGMRINDIEQVQIGMFAMRSDWIHVCNIYVTDGSRGRGFGSECLDRLCQRADDLGVNIQLIAATSGGMSQRQLEQWYERRGFEKIDEGNGWMHRIAKIGATA